MCVCLDSIHFKLVFFYGIRNYQIRNDKIFSLFHSLIFSTRNIQFIINGYNIKDPTKFRH